VTHSGIRVLSLLLTAALVWVFSEVRTQLPVVYSIALGHYVLALVYSAPHLRRLLADANRRGPLGLLVAAGSLLFAVRVPATWYFSVHHALNETYMLDRVTRARGEEVRKLREASGILHFVLYLALARDAFVFRRWIDETAVLAALGAAYLFFVWRLTRARHRLDGRELVDNCAGEVLGLAVLGLSFAVPIQVIWIALYHFVFWILQPLRGLASAGGVRLARYLVGTVLVTAGFLAISPLAPSAWSLGFSPFQQLFRVLTFVHITLSFALSAANPPWLRERFLGTDWSPTPASARAGIGGTLRTTHRGGGESRGR
jgi:hypothetical protein